MNFKPSIILDSRNLEEIQLFNIQEKFLNLCDLRINLEKKEENEWHKEKSRSFSSWKKRLSKRKCKRNKKFWTKSNKFRKTKWKMKEKKMRKKMKIALILNTIGSFVMIVQKPWNKKKNIMFVMNAVNICCASNVMIWSSTSTKWKEQQFQLVQDHLKQIKQSKLCKN